MKLCITGAPCVGKSTITIKLKKELKIQSIHPQFNSVKNQLFPNKEYTQLTQTEIEELVHQVITQRFQLEKQQKSFISEGGVYYDLAWIIFFFNQIIKKEFNFDKIIHLIHQNQNYDKILYIPIQFKFQDRNRPFENEFAQQKINEIILQIFHTLNIKPTQITGTIEERINQIKQIIK